MGKSVGVRNNLGERWRIQGYRLFEAPGDVARTKRQVAGLFEITVLAVSYDLAAVMACDAFVDDITITSIEVVP